MEVIFMVTRRQHKGVVFGIIWSLLGWIPYYTDYLGFTRSFLGIPATLGLNLELFLGRGDGFVFSILLGAGIGFVIGSLLDIFRGGIKIVGLFPRKKRRLLGKGI